METMGYQTKHHDTVGNLHNTMNDNTDCDKDTNLIKQVHIPIKSMVQSVHVCSW